TPASRTDAVRLVEPLAARGAQELRQGDGAREKVKLPSTTLLLLLHAFASRLADDESGLADHATDSGIPRPPTHREHSHGKAEPDPRSEERRVGTECRTSGAQ